MEPNPFRILWPEIRFVSAEWIERCYADAIANGECDRRAGIRGAEAMARELDRAGVITLAAR